MIQDLKQSQNGMSMLVGHRRGSTQRCYRLPGWLSCKVGYALGMNIDAIEVHLKGEEE